MKHLTAHIRKAFLALLLLAAGTRGLFAQCAGSTPNLPVNLTSSATASYTSTSVSRNGTCCSHSSSYNCVKFTVSVHSNCAGIIVTATGSTSNMIIDVGCSGSYSLGDSICLTGTGPFTVTACRTGGTSSQTFTIKSFAKPTANAGNDTTICTAKNYIILNGSVSTNTNSFQWYGNGGSFFAGNTTLTNNRYVPSQTEIDNGSTYVVLAATGVCGTVYDTLNIGFYDAPVPVISGASVACSYSTGNLYSVTATSGHTYDWHLVGGRITSGQSTSQVNVTWDSAGPGYIYMIETDANGCQGVGAIQTISRFDFNSSPLTHATIGPDASSADADAYSNGYGYQITNNCGGSKGVDLTVPGSVFDRGKMCMTFSWQRDENEATFFQRGGVKFFITGGVLNINLRISNGSGGFTDVGPLSTGYTVPNDDVFRYFTFCYDSLSGYARVMVHDSLVWSYNGTPNRSLYWTSAGSAQMGLIMDGSCSGNPLLDWGNISIPISIVGKPKYSISGTTPVCVNKNGTYTATGTGNNIKYTWAVTGGTIQSGQSTSSITVKWNSIGTGVVQLTAKDSINGCDSVMTKNVTVMAGLIGIVGPDSICQSSSGMFIANPSGSSYSFQWTATGGTFTGTSTDDTAIITYTSGGSKTISLKMKNMVTGCDSIVSKTIFVDSLPVAAVTGSSPVCAYSTGQIYQTTNAANYSYSWSVTGGTQGASASPYQAVVNWGAPGTGTVSVTVTKSPLGCQKSASKIVTISTKPSTKITGPDSICQSSAGLFVGTPTGAGYTYQWTATGGTFTGVSNDDTARISYTSGGTKTITLKITDNATGCDSTISKNIFVDSLPVASVTGASPVCQWTTGNVYQTTTGTGYSYSWSAIGGTTVSSALPNQVIVNWGAAGSGSVSVTVTKSPLGCQKSNTKSVTIQSKPATKITSPDSICQGSAGLFVGTPTGAGYAYQWTATGGTFTGGITNDDTARISYASGGTKTVTLKITDNATGCDSTISKNIFIDSLPIAAVTGTTPVCQWTAGQVYQTTAKAGYNYSWSISDGTITSGTTSSSATVTWGAAGSGSISVTVTKSPLGCQASNTKNITISSRPSTAISGPDSICQNSAGTFIASPSGASYSYQWTAPGGTFSGSSTSDTARISYTSGGSKTITLKITNISTGCDSTVNKTIFVDSLPVAIITGNNPVCQGSTGNVYQTTPGSGYSYSWNVTGGTITSGAISSSATVTWGLPVSGTVNLTVTKAPLGCQKTASKTIIINAKPITGLINHY